jgi:hypothetical protein
MTVVKARVSSRRQLSEELRRLFPDRPPAGLVVVAFDHVGRPCGLAANSQHQALSWVKVWELAALATELQAHSLLVAVFPRGTAPTPSAHEVAVFSDLMVRTRRAGFVLRDCCVYRGDRMWSLRELQEERTSA